MKLLHYLLARRQSQEDIALQRLQYTLRALGEGNREIDYYRAYAAVTAVGLSPDDLRWIAADYAETGHVGQGR